MRLPSFRPTPACLACASDLSQVHPVISSSIPIMRGQDIFRRDADDVYAAVDVGPHDNIYRRWDRSLYPSSYRFPAKAAGMRTTQPRIMAVPPTGARNGSGLAPQKWMAARSATKTSPPPPIQEGRQARRPVTAGQQRQHQHRRCLGERDQRQGPEDMRIAEMRAAGCCGHAEPECRRWRWRCGRTRRLPRSWRAPGRKTVIAS